MKIVEINPKECIRWKGADRSGFEFGDSYTLGKDIVKNGQIEPVIARPVTNAEFKYEIISGSRRWKACSELGIPLKAIIKQLSDEEAFLTQIKENEKMPICDYSKGVCFQQALERKIFK